MAVRLGHAVCRMPLPSEARAWPMVRPYALCGMPMVWCTPSEGWAVPGEGDREGWAVPGEGDRESRGAPPKRAHEAGRRPVSLPRPLCLARARVRHLTPTGREKRREPYLTAPVCW